MRDQQPIFSVSQINEYIKSLMDRDGLLGGVFIRGELSNYKVYPSGHHYFSLKDEGARSAASFSGGRPPGSGSGRRTA